MGKPMVLVVDDQPEYARLISLVLAREGFEVRSASDGEEAIERAAELHPDIVLLDINMPGLDGFEVMSQLRERRAVPIMMVTGDQQLRQQTLGLDSGADDYVTKPFSAHELVARVRALLRRTRGPRALGPRPGLATDGRRMSRRASRLLDIFTANPTKVLYHDELLAYAFGPAFVGDTALLHEEIRHLRRALGVQAGSQGPIRTVKGVGYRLEPDAESAEATRRSNPALRRSAGRA